MPSKNSRGTEKKRRLIFYKGDYHEYGQVIVHEGDSLTTDFELDTATGEWTDKLDSCTWC